MLTKVSTSPILDNKHFIIESILIIQPCKVELFLLKLSILFQDFPTSEIN